MARREQGDALAYEDRQDVHVECVDLAGVENRGDQLTSAHHSDVLARRAAHAGGEFLHGLREEGHSVAVRAAGARENT